MRSAKGRMMEGRIIGVNLVLMDQDVDAKVTFDLEKVSIYQTLALMAEMSNLTIRIQNGMVLFRKEG